MGNLKYHFEAILYCDNNKVLRQTFYDGLYTSFNEMKEVHKIEHILYHLKYKYDPRNPQFDEETHSISHNDVLIYFSTGGWFLTYHQDYDEFFNHTKNSWFSESFELINRNFMIEFLKFAHDRCNINTTKDYIFTNFSPITDLLRVSDLNFEDIKQLFPIRVVDLVNFWDVLQSNIEKRFLTTQLWLSKYRYFDTFKYFQKYIKILMNITIDNLYDGEKLIDIKPDEKEDIDKKEDSNGKDK
jgi:hypothetical protein